MDDLRRHRLRWREYRTESGKRPVRDFLRELEDEDRAKIVEAMRETRSAGLRFARHLRGEIWELRVQGEHGSYRILFATEGKRRQVLLALEAFTKKTARTPPHLIRLAERRLADWRSRSHRLRRQS